jgi:hypothetical protein
MGWRPVTCNADTETVLVLSALIRQQCPKNLRTEGASAPAPMAGDDRLVRWPKGCPSSTL